MHNLTTMHKTVLIFQPEYIITNFNEHLTHTTHNFENFSYITTTLDKSFVSNRTLYLYSLRYVILLKPLCFILTFSNIFIQQVVIFVSLIVDHENPIDMSNFINTNVLD